MNRSKAFLGVLVVALTAVAESAPYPCGFKEAVYVLH